MDFEHEDSFNQKWKADGNSVTETEAETEKENSDNCFDCHICLDFAHEPVVTLCGHLFCWSCIYKWLFVQRASLAPDEHPQCPVCKHDISHTKMVPLYGRGQSQTRRGRNRKATLEDISIPPRPPASEIQSLLETPTSPQTDQQENDDTSQVQNLDTLVTPVIPRYMFGNYEDLHHMMANKSLNKIYFFLFLCFVLCLILF